MFMPKQPSEGFFKKRCYENFCRIYMKTSEPESLFWVFSCDFCEIFKNILFKNILLLIIAVSIVAKGVLANQSVNYDTKTKAYILI